jgi:hypothetical protein
VVRQSFCAVQGSHFRHSLLHDRSPFFKIDGIAQDALKASGNPAVTFFIGSWLIRFHNGPKLIFGVTGGKLVKGQQENMPNELCLL